MPSKALPFAILALLVGPVVPADASEPGATIRAVVEAERAGDCGSVSDFPLDDVEAVVASARLARCALTEGEFDRAQRLVEGLDRASPAGSAAALDVLQWLPEVRARAALLAGRATEAAVEFSALREQSGRRPAGVRARLTYYEALALEASGDPAGARDAYRDLQSRYPATAWALRAQLAAPALEPDGERALEMAQRALDARNYPAAEALLTLAACGTPEGCVPRDPVASGDPVRYEAVYRIGFLLYRFRREFVARSLPWFETVIHFGGGRAVDARHDYAHAVVRLGRYDEARRALRDFAAAYPDDPRADGAAYEAAWLLLAEDRYDEAASAFEAYRRSGGARRDDAAWWVGWARFQAGDCDAATSAWSGDSGTRVAYWNGVCAHRRGRRADAERVWRDLIARDPWGYYGLLARRRLGESPVPPPLRTAVRSRAAVTGAAAVAAGLGLADEARAIALPAGPIEDPFERLAIESRRSDWVEWSRVWESSAQSVPETVAERDAWDLAHPRFYEETVVDVAARESIPPEVVWAVMQKESAYNPRALSRSDAMGLMQVIPQTGEAIARTLGERYADGMLFEPYHAIRYGGWYLGALRRHFRGDLVLAVAGYNAGPIAVEAWVDRNGGRPIDEFVEEIPADQTRNYVRRVISIAARYAIAARDPDVCGSDHAGGLLPDTVRDGYDEVVDF